MPWPSIASNGGPHVQVFSGKDNSLLNSFFAYDSGFLGGIFVAAGDLNGDGQADIVTGVGPGGGPHVKAFDGKTGTTIRNFFAYDPGFSFGIFVAAGDINGDGRADIITGSGKNGGPHIQVHSGLDNSLLKSFFAYAGNVFFGIRVGAVDFNGDGHADIITGVGAGGGPHVRILDGLTLQELDNFFAFDLGFTGGIFVGG